MHLINQFLIPSPTCTLFNKRFMTLKEWIYAFSQTTLSSSLPYFSNDPQWVKHRNFISFLEMYIFYKQSLHGFSPDTVEPFPERNTSSRKTSTFTPLSFMLCINHTQPRKQSKKIFLLRGNFKYLGDWDRRFLTGSWCLLPFWKEFMSSYDPGLRICFTKQELLIIL